MLLYPFTWWCESILISVQTLKVFAGTFWPQKMLWNKNNSENFFPMTSDSFAPQRKRIIHGNHAFVYSNQKAQTTVKCVILFGVFFSLCVIFETTVRSCGAIPDFIVNSWLSLPGIFEICRNLIFAS